jgi:hypothetical protein
MAIVITTETIAIAAVCLFVAFLWRVRGEEHVGLQRSHAGTRPNALSWPLDSFRVVGLSSPDHSPKLA